ncbi:hypothetical protein C8J57DRAFT_1222839, partial [Mycena rebaudengoi]
VEVKRETEREERKKESVGVQASYVTDSSRAAYVKHARAVYESWLRERQISERLGCTRGHGARYGVAYKSVVRPACLKSARTPHKKYDVHKCLKNKAPDANEEPEDGKKMKSEQDGDSSARQFFSAAMRWACAELLQARSLTSEMVVATDEGARMGTVEAVVLRRSQTSFTKLEYRGQVRMRRRLEWGGAYERGVLLRLQKATLRAIVRIYAGRGLDRDYIIVETADLITLLPK